MNFTVVTHVTLGSVERAIKHVDKKVTQLVNYFVLSTGRSWPDVCESGHLPAFNPLHYCVDCRVA